MTSSTPRPHLNGHRPHLNGTGPRFGAVPFAEKIDSAIDRAVGRLFDLQYDDGYWWGELEANCAIHAEYLLLTHFMDVPDPERWRKVVNYLKSMQLDDGGWPIWYGGPSDLSIAVECYFAMKLAGEPPDDPAMTKAREFILAQGGVPNTRVFTKMWLALFGQWEWAATPVLPSRSCTFLPGSRSTSTSLPVGRGHDRRLYHPADGKAGVSRAGVGAH